jgi:hypothetical protein
MAAKSSVDEVLPYNNAIQPTAIPLRSIAATDGERSAQLVDLRDVDDLARNQDQRAEWSSSQAHPTESGS